MNHVRSNPYRLLVLLVFVCAFAGPASAAATYWTNYAEEFSPEDPSAEPSTFGSPDNPWLIENAAQLAYLAAQVNEGIHYNGAHFVQTEDLDLSAHQWVPIGKYFDSRAFGGDEERTERARRPFRGVYFGNGRTIRGLHISGRGDAQGLWGYLGWGGELDGIDIGDCRILLDEGRYAAALVGYIIGGTVNRCSATGEIRASEYVAGLVGVAHGNTVANSSAACTLRGGHVVGGLIGQSSGLVLNCYAASDLIGTLQVGGLVGYVGDAPSRILYSYATGSVKGGRNVGGLAGVHTGSIVCSYSTCDVDGASAVGGLVGSFSGSISNCYAAGRVEVSGKKGEFIGAGRGQIRDSCFNADTMPFRDDRRQGNAMNVHSLKPEQMTHALPAGLRNDTRDWVLREDFYPQLAVFAENGSGRDRYRSLISVLP